jgi:hypothetical protein
VIFGELYQQFYQLFCEAMRVLSSGGGLEGPYDGSQSIEKFPCRSLIQVERVVFPHFDVNLRPLLHLFLVTRTAYSRSTESHKSRAIITIKLKLVSLPPSYDRGATAQAIRRFSLKTDE